MLASMILTLEVADAPNQVTEAILILHLKDFFKVLAQKDVHNWVETFTKTERGEHLPYALTLEMHNNCLSYFARFATDFSQINAVLTGQEIPFSALDFYHMLRANVLNNWQKASAADTLGPYVSPLSTWVSPRVNKEASRKVAKTTETLTPGLKQPARTNTTTTSQSMMPRSAGSNPNWGMIQAPNNIHHGPQLPSGKRLCLAFAVTGQSCSNRYNCANAHISMKNGSLPDLQAIDRWVTDTANITWAHRHPARLNDATATTTPATPPASTLAARVSPQTANSDQG
jgi:hypothetical protein